MFNRELKEENTRLRYRIKELEEKLCPDEDHDWKLIGTDFNVNYTISDVDNFYRYKCRRCGKEKKNFC